MTRTHSSALRGIGLACLMALTMTACGSSDDGGSASGSPEDVAAALEEGGTITVWAWEPTLEQVVADFEAEYPNVDVELVNAGTNTTQYTALQNAISAGSGVPDVAQIEYYALGQFTVAEALTDLSSYGASELDGTFSAGPWNAVQAGEGIYGLPMDSGPMALFYNQDVFDEHGIEVPTTWDEYVEAARTLHEADPNLYIGSDTGDPGTTTSMIWQAGGHPYTVDGTNVTVDFTDPGSTAYAETWQQLIDEELLAPITGWTDEWYQALGDGTIATLIMGAWMPANLESGVPDGAGSWRVAPLPQWEEGANASAENGGSSLAVPAASQNKALAYAFLEYANAGDGVATRVAAGAFPATTAELSSEEFLNAEFEYFGGQQANQIFADSAANVVEGWSYLPYQVYANSIFNDTVGQAYVSDTTLTEGLAAWQQATIDYGTEQGFTVNQ
ncbi:ABC transporter substrate-binding protein [Allostreptomyces psammosilenae]|uniref:Multiple sugar transport system substrate-binding protein n=1 Tax=Allostreptomyces psammosilenae TaxID=1892865 RepID=A0A852ZPU0_9ACTN|nr:sugar ABC transporter substrate-binding protein [Allostreptomyces psammosilenae]NYI03507.1 multiple sugar transport system substrate-binding protein [Allostreptomyces psammosilenae]